MKHGLSDQVRELAERRHVHPAVRAGQPRFSLSVRDLMRDLQPTGFPGNNWPQICSAIQAEKFLRANGLEIESVEGPPSGQSSTVVVHYRVVSRAGERLRQDTGSDQTPKVSDDLSNGEDASARALRLTEKLRGLLKEETRSIRRRRGVRAMGAWL